MIQQSDVDKLQRRLEDLRGAICRNSGTHDRVDALRRDANNMLKEARGTDFEPALKSVATLLDCLRRGLQAQSKLNSTDADTDTDTGTDRAVA